MPRGSKTDKSTQITALTLLARGDTVRDISEQLGISEPVVTNIKKKNLETLNLIRQKHLEKRIQSSGKILDKANKLINRKLETADKDTVIKNDLLEQYRNGEIDYKEYQKQVFGLVDLSISELTRVSSEMQNQIQKNESEVGNDSSPEESKEQMEQLMKAIKDGDQVIMERLVFGSKSE